MACERAIRILPVAVSTEQSALPELNTVRRAHFVVRDSQAQFGSGETFDCSLFAAKCSRLRRLLTGAPHPFAWSEGLKESLATR